MSRGVGAWMLAMVAALAMSADVARSQEFTKYAVSCQERYAAEVGREVLRNGGNAVDAAIATAFALAVTHPAAGNIGGGGFMLYYDAKTQTPDCIEFRERAPARATETMYLDAEGRLVPHHRAGPRAAGVPGTVRGMELAHKKYGSRPWAELVLPAVKLAREGIAVSDTLARSLNAQLFRNAPASGVAEDLGSDTDELADFEASVAAFRKKDGTRWKAGEILTQPDLANTLERIATGGADEFYKGTTAKLIVDWMEAGGGLIGAEDLAAYTATVRPVTRVSYKGHDVVGIGPPSSGGIVTGIALNILERYDLKADGRDSARTLHRVTEAMRRAYYVRATQVADPDVVHVDTAKLTSKEFADKLAATIDEAKATPSRSLADFPIAGINESAHTTHFSVVDANRNAVAMTYTLEEGYGSKSVVPGAGFLLNNEMGDFNLIPGRTDAQGRIGTKANLIAPGKRMLSSQTPTIVLKDGNVLLVTGSPGGRTIPNTVLWVLLGVLEFGMNPRDAVDAPRTHHPWFPDELLLEGSRWPEGLRPALEKMGHRVGRMAIQGDAHSISVDPATGHVWGLPDRRRETGFAAGD
jgi:gamma-glutamyltranspeptidase/glutathione hydrolase